MNEGKIEDMKYKESCGVRNCDILPCKFYIHCSVHHYNCSKIITNKMTLVDYRPSLYMFRAAGSSSSGVSLFYCTGSLWHTV